MKRIAIFASGEGTNAEIIIKHFKKGSLANVVLVVSNNPNAGVLERAVNNDIAILILDRKNFFSDDSIIKFLISEKLDLIVLAGFLWKIPNSLIEAFPNKIMNIHPSLLPKYGGKGMYGMNVHRAVIEAGERETGISIHYVNENFDEGEILFQANCKVEDNDNLVLLSKKVQQLEHLYYSEIIEKELLLKSTS